MPERNSTPYPYAQPKTFEFVKAAIAEGAHLKLPARRHFRLEADLETEWIKARNIAGIYFTSPAVLEDIGKMYGYKAEREGPRLVVAKFLRNLWENSSEALREQYPISELKIRKPLTKRSKFRLSRGRGGRLERIDKLFEEGKNFREVAEILDMPVSRVNTAAKILDRAELVSSSQVRNKILIESLNNLPDKVAERQVLIDQIKRKFLATHPEHFIRMRGLLLQLRIRWPHGTTLDQYISQIQKAGVAVGVIENKVNSRKMRNIFMFKEDVEKHFEEIKEKFNLDPSETQGPIL